MRYIIRHSRLIWLCLLLALSGLTIFAYRNYEASLRLRPQGSTKASPLTSKRTAERISPTGTLAPTQSGGSFNLPQTVIAGGGERGTGGGNEVEGTIGQAVTAKLSGGTFAIEEGFWPDAVPTPLLTITAENKTKVYGAPNPPFAVTYAGFVGGDGPASLGGTLSFTTNATAGSNVGMYTITPGGLTSANYAIQFVNGTLNITKAPLTITTDNKTRLPGVANPPLAGTVTGIVNNDNIVVTWMTTATINSPSGAYPITPVIADPDNRLGNYQVAQSNGVLTVACPSITLTPATLPNGVLGTAYNQTLTASPAGGNYSYTVTTGILPPGLTLASNGVLSGTPTAGGNYAFAVTVTGWGACTKTQSHSLLITGTCAPITVNPATLPGAMTGTAYSQTLTVNPVGTYSFAVTQGALPNGLTLNTNSGIISGTPTTSGSFSFRITATGTGGCIGSRNYVVTVSCAPLTIAPATLPNGAHGVAYSQQLSVSTGGNPVGSATFSLLLGSLPPDFNLSSAGLLSGTTTQTGTYNFTIKVLAGTCQNTKAYTLVISNSAAALAMRGDYDGDGKSDPALWSASDGVWRIVKSRDGQAVSLSWGTAGDLTLLGDYDGDGKSDLAVFRPAEATFYILKSGRSSDGSFLMKQWGLATDIPVPGDYDGDGRTDLAVWRGATGTWYIVRSSDGQYDVHVWGASEAPYQDVPVAGDYDGDGRSDVAVFRRGNGTWLIKRSSDGQYITKQWGLGTDVPVAADYDGDGQTDIAVWRGGTWYIWQSALNAYRVTTWGTAGDQVGTGDYDGDGQADLAVWQPTEARWSFKCSSDGSLRQQTLGRSGDATVPSKP
jgi:hypothetical protein